MFLLVYVTTSRKSLRHNTLQTSGNVVYKKTIRGYSHPVEVDGSLGGTMGSLRVKRLIEFMELKS